MTDEDLNDKVVELTNIMLAIIGNSKEGFLVSISAVSSVLFTICKLQELDDFQVEKVLRNIMNEWDKKTKAESRKIKFKKVKHEEIPNNS